jgi:hypothetical protein
MKLLTLSSITILIFIHGSAYAELPPGWRIPTSQELAIEVGWEEAPNHAQSISADFDGDKKEDLAQLLLNDAKNKMALFVMLSSRNFSPLLLDEMADKRTIHVMGIGVADPGEYKTACGKGYWKCEKNDPELLHLKYSAIDYFKAESANSFFVWNQNLSRFDRIWMSD